MFKQHQQITRGITAARPTTSTRIGDIFKRYETGAAPYLAHNNSDAYAAFISIIGIARALNISLSDATQPVECSNCGGNNTTSDENATICADCQHAAYEIPPIATQMDWRTNLEEQCFVKHIKFVQGVPGMVPLDVIDRARCEIPSANRFRVIQWMRSRGLNKHINQAVCVSREVGGCVPKYLTDVEERRITQLFNVLKDAHHELFGAANISHRYILFKLLEHVGRRDVAAFIRLPSVKTLIVLDRRFQKMCAHVGRGVFDYAPTQHIVQTRVGAAAADNESIV